jgi:type VI protein secretion system component Hcp
MAVSSVRIRLSEFTITKTLDSASPQLALAVAGGDPLGTSKLLLYNAAPAGPPDARLDFFNTLASSYQTNGITEEVTFNSVNPLALFLEVPGIPGESNTPGHPDVIQLESFALSGNEFEIVKQQDSASPALFLANVMGEFFPATRLLVYDSLPPGAAPDVVIEFQDLYITSSQILQGGGQPLEEHTFSFNTLAQVPEPGAMLLVVLAGAVVAVRRRCT